MLLNVSNYFMATKRSRHDIDLLTKYKIVKLVNQGMKQSEIVKKFDVNESTICRIKKNKDNISKESNLVHQAFYKEENNV